MRDDRTRRAPPRYLNGGFSPGRALREFAANQLRLMDRMATMDSPVVATRFGPVPTWLVLDADLARQVLVTDEESYERPAFVVRMFVDAMGRNLFTATGSAWSGRRRLLQPRFTRSHVDGLVETMAATIADEVSGWPADTTLDVQACLTDLTLRVAAQALIGLDIARHELGFELRRHFEGVLGWISHRFYHLSAPPALVPTRRNRQMARHRSELEAIIRRLVAQRRQSDDRPADVLHLLIEATDDTGGPLTDDEIVGECVGFLFAGHETTASTLTWALYLLASTPDAQDRVAAEGDQLLASATPTPEALHQLDYTSRVVEETLRLYPPAIAIARKARRSTSLGGYRLRRGTAVLIAFYAIGRDPHHWPDPTTFNPDRFAPNGDLAGAHAHLPFGLGPRQCLGARFATTEARLTLATITSRWQISLSQPVNPKPRVELALRVDGGLPLQLRRRDTAHLAV